MSDKSLVVIEQENLELRKENVGLKDTLTILMAEIERLRDLTSNPVTGIATKIAKAEEEHIIFDQIGLLSLASKQRVLTLEEIRALDLLIKNKKLLEPKTPIETDYTKVPPGSSEGDLLRIAGNVESPKPRNKPKSSKKDTVA